MKLPFTAFQLPLAAATERASTVWLPGRTAWSTEISTAPRSTARQEHKVRQLTSLTEHRAQVLTQRRTPVRTSAKRW
ncbi:hypothetical protein [Hymenobacter algoricola]|uniref:Secreted protein n=1 Tax=Hymenobacter algoricola TaxID=486267 RepID=A0ABP7NKU4_9BACT